MSLSLYGTLGTFDRGVAVPASGRAWCFVGETCTGPAAPPFGTLTRVVFCTQFVLGQNVLAPACEIVQVPSTADRLVLLLLPAESLSAVLLSDLVASV